MKTVIYQITIHAENEKPCLRQMIQQIQRLPGMRLRPCPFSLQATGPPNVPLAYAGMGICFRLIFNLCIALWMSVCKRIVFVPDGVIIYSHFVMGTRKRP